jgi:predicted aconitase
MFPFWRPRRSQLDEITTRVGRLETALLQLQQQAQQSNQKERADMSKISDAIAAANASALAMVQRVTTEQAALQAEIDSLTTNATTQADVDAVAALQAISDGLDPTNPATLPADVAAAAAVPG